MSQLEDSIALHLLLNKVRIRHTPTARYKSPISTKSNDNMAAQSTTVLIVGAGPTGLAAAISLVNSGFRDFVIVDRSVSRGVASRAISIHAATLEVLRPLADPN